MNTSPRRRITVVLIDKPQSRELLTLGATIASLLQAEIEGVFIEDDALFRLTGLPFLRELRWGSRDEARLDPIRLAQEWRAMAKQTRKALEELAEGSGLSWSFRVWRGEYDSDLEQLATDSEMLLMSGQGTLSGRRIPARFRSAPAASHPLKLGVILDRGMAKQNLLDTITELAQKPEIELILFLPPDDGDPTEEALREHLSQHDPEEQINYVQLTDKEPANLAMQLKRSACDLLMISERSSLLRRPTIKQVLEDLPYPTVVVR